VKVSLADPLKRICKEVFDFSDEQLWGPSEKRNESDPRYQRYPHESIRESIARDIDEEGFSLKPRGPMFLTPRYALQQLGTEWGRNCYDNVWIDYAVRVANTLLNGRLDDNPGAGAMYSCRDGLKWAVMPKKPAGVVIPDVRFKNEVDGLKKAGAVLIRVKRPGAGLEGAAATHASEAEQDGVTDDAFDVILDNSGDLIELHLKVKQVMQMLKGEAQIEQAAEQLAHMLENIPEEVPIDPKGPLAGLLKQREADIKAGRLMEYDESQKNVPPFKRRK
jgi:hypothetical protein